MSKIKPSESPELYLKIEVQMFYFLFLESLQRVSFNHHLTCKSCSTQKQLFWKFSLDKVRVNEQFFLSCRPPNRSRIKISIRHECFSSNFPNRKSILKKFLKGLVLKLIYVTYFSIETNDGIVEHGLAKSRFFFSLFPLLLIRVLTFCPIFCGLSDKFIQADLIKYNFFSKRNVFYAFLIISLIS